jgi:dTDP-4-dehydrorhamnose 3,5-epimerase
MDIIKTAIEGVFIIEPKVFGDDRGYFLESFNAREFAEKTGLNTIFVQDNESKSRYGVLRGLHYQLPPFAQSKLVRVVKGRVVDVAVDIRKGSPTYGKHVTCELTEENHRQFFVPKGMAHGFVVLSDEAVFQYKCDNFYHPEAEGGIAWDDSDLAVKWPISTEAVSLSERDKHHPAFKDFDSPFEF